MFAVASHEVAHVDLVDQSGYFERWKVALPVPSSTPNSQLEAFWCVRVSPLHRSSWQIGFPLATQLRRLDVWRVKTCDW